MSNELSVKDNLLFLLGYIKKFKTNFMNFYFGMLAQTIIEILGPVILGFIINEIVYYKNMSTFAGLSGLYAFMILFQCGNYFIIYTNHHYLNSMYVLEIRDKLFKKIIYGKSSFLSDMNAGEITAIADEYTDDCLHFVVRNFFHFFNNLIVMVWCGYFLLRINIPFGLFLCGMLILQVVITLMTNKKIMKLSDDRVSLYGKHIRFLTSILGSLKDIQLLTADFFVAKVFKKKYWDFRDKDMAIRVGNFELEKNVEGIHTVLLLFIYIFSMYLIFNDNILIGTFLTVITYFDAIKWKMLYVIYSLTGFNENLAKIERIRELFQMESEKEFYHEGDKVAELNGNISLKQCSFRYKDNLILDQVSFEIKQGEKTAIVGESGTGKSTILSLILGMYTVEHGEIEIGQKNIKDLDIYSLRKHISVVNQEIFILNDTIRNNLLLTKKDATEDELMQAVKLAQLEEFVNGLPDGLDTVLESDGSNLSGGQKQRIAIARAFLKDSSIILLDEATSALDTETEYGVNKALKTFSDKKTIVVVSHRLLTVMECDKVVVIINGKVAECGHPKDLMQEKGAFYQLFQEKE